MSLGRLGEAGTAEFLHPRRADAEEARGAEARAVAARAAAFPAADVLDLLRVLVDARRADAEEARGAETRAVAARAAAFAATLRAHTPSGDDEKEELRRMGHVVLDCKRWEGWGGGRKGEVCGGEGGLGLSFPTTTTYYYSSHAVD